MSTIYLLKDSQGYYKIGFTKNPINKRIKQLETGCAEDLELVFQFETRHNRKLETSLHNLFKHKHVNREFYDLTLEDEIKFKEICESLETAFNII
jgi:hypothetical protein